MTREQLAANIRKKRSYLCIGLDTDISKIPKHLLGFADPVFEFNRRIIEATSEYCVAYKPNLAFYEALGPDGLRTLADTIRLIPDNILAIADAKRGDIGNTAEMYADAFFNRYGFDAITVAPYMGKDSVQPFLKHADKWTILLALTSNAGSLDFQMTEICHPGVTGERKLFEQVLTHAKGWGSSEQLMFVVGATHPELFKAVRKIVPDHFLLVPGVGAQGGDLGLISEAGLNSACGLIVNSSRQIIYAGDGEDFAEKAAEEAKRIQEQMSSLLEKYLSW